MLILGMYISRINKMLYKMFVATPVWPVSFCSAYFENILHVVLVSSESRQCVCITQNTYTLVRSAVFNLKHSSILNRLTELEAK
jgi:hypothetical protein